MLESYRQHVAERAALGIPPLPLSAQQTADLVQLLRQRIVSQLEEDGIAADLVSAVAGDPIPDQQLLSERSG